MKLNSDELISGQLSNVDRFLDLPDFIVYHIISFLGTNEAYRASILSKRWARILYTNPILEIHYYSALSNSYSRYWPFEEASAELLEYIDVRMRKYHAENLCMKSLTLRFPNSSSGCSRGVEDLSHKFDEWLRIAVCNQVAELHIDGPANYELPDILLSAKSLRRFSCNIVKLPYCNKAIDLASLEALYLSDVVIEERMLNNIISSCRSLKDLSLYSCSGVTTIVIPSCSQLEHLDVTESLAVNGTVILETSSLVSFQILDMFSEHRWPIMSKPGLWRNLKTLEIYFIGITDVIFGKILPELSSLETLKFCNCYMLWVIRISSTQLKEVRLNRCTALSEVSIDAPNLKLFKYAGEFDDGLSVTVNTQANCDVSVHMSPYDLDTQGFLKLKKILNGISCCNFLKVYLMDESNQRMCDFIKFDDVELENANVNLGPPCEIRELKITLSRWLLLKSSASAFLNGLFWVCHPDIISFRVHLRDPSLTIQVLMIQVENMANSWRHPLKRVEVQGANCSNLLDSNKVDVQLRLHW